MSTNQCNTKKAEYVKTDLRRYRRTYLSISILFLVLGIGNTVFGHLKVTEYRTILSESRNSSSLANIKRGKFSKMITPSPNAANTSSSLQSVEVYIARVRSRIQLYNIVTLAGKMFLAFFGIFLLASLLHKEDATK